MSLFCILLLYSALFSFKLEQSGDLLYALLYTPWGARFPWSGSADQQIIKLPDEILVFGPRSGKFLLLDPCADLPFRVVMLWVSLFKCFHNGIRFLDSYILSVKDRVRSANGLVPVGLTIAFRFLVVVPREDING